MAILAVVATVAVVGLSLSAAGIDDGSVDVELDDDEPGATTNQTIEFSLADESNHTDNELTEIDIEFADTVSNLSEIDGSNVTVKHNGSDVEEDGKDFLWKEIGGTDIHVWNDTADTLTVDISDAELTPGETRQFTVEIEGIENPDVDVVDGYEYTVGVESYDDRTFDWVPWVDGDTEYTNATTEYELSTDGPSWPGDPPSDPDENGDDEPELELELDYTDDIEVGDATEMAATATNPLDTETTVDVTLEIDGDQWTERLEIDGGEAATATFDGAGADLEEGDYQIAVTASSPDIEDDTTDTGTLSVSENRDAGPDEGNGDDTDASADESSESDLVPTSWPFNVILGVFITVWAVVLGLLAWRS